MDQDRNEMLRENRLRKKAVRTGYWLGKSRARNPERDGYGRFVVRDADTGFIVAGLSNFGWPTLTLDDVEAFLVDD